MAINKEQVLKWLIEGVDAFLVIVSVLICGMVALYYNVFWIELQDILGYEDRGVAIVHSYERAVENNKVVVEGSGLEDVESLLASIDNISSKSTSHYTGLYEYDMDDYLNNSLGSYELPFSAVPPGRFITIPSIGVQAPIVAVPDSSEEKVKEGDFVEELRQGVVKYPHTTEPGKIGNTLVFGHSSVDMLQAKHEDFGYIFYKLPKLNEGDLIQVVWDGEIFEYEVTEKLIKWPKDVPDEVNQKVDVDMLTLMACYPLMSDAQRILVKALPRKSGNNALLAFNGGEMQ